MRSCTSPPAFGFPDHVEMLTRGPRVLQIGEGKGWKRRSITGRWELRRDVLDVVEVERKNPDTRG